MTRKDIKYSIKCIWLGILGTIALEMAKIAIFIDKYIGSQQSPEFEEWVSNEQRKNHR